jgi:hypothetical protein
MEKGRSRVITPLTLNLRTRWTGVVNFTPRPLYPSSQWPLNAKQPSTLQNLYPSKRKSVSSFNSNQAGTERRTNTSYCASLSYIISHTRQLRRMFRNCGRIFVNSSVCWVAIGSSETSVSNHLPPRNNPEDGRETATEA